MRGKGRWFQYVAPAEAVLAAARAMEAAYATAVAAAEDSGRGHNRSIAIESLVLSAFPAGVPVGRDDKEVLLLWVEAEKLLFAIGLGGRPFGDKEEMIVGKHLPCATGPTGMIPTPPRKAPAGATDR